MTRAVAAISTLFLLTAMVLASGKSRQPTSTNQMVAKTEHFEEIGIRPLSHKEVKKRFATGLKKEHLVLEVTLAPKQELDVERRQFGVRLQGSDAKVRPLDPEILAAEIRGTKPPRTVAVAPVATIGYESGNGRRYPYDNRRRSGLYTNVGVGVGVGKGPGLTREDQSVMAQELADKELPLGTVDGKVQGYLYFPVKVNRNQPLSLVFEHEGETVVLSFRRP